MHHFGALELESRLLSLKSLWGFWLLIKGIHAPPQTGRHAQLLRDIVLSDLARPKIFPPLIRLHG